MSLDGQCHYILDAQCQTNAGAKTFVQQTVEAKRNVQI